MTPPKAGALPLTLPVKEVDSAKKDVSGSPQRGKEQHAAPPPVMVKSSREKQARGGAVSKMRALTPFKSPAAPRPLIADVLIECLIEEEEEEEEEQRCEGVCVFPTLHLHYII